MEKIKPKRPIVIRDLRKIKALLYLSMRQQTEFKYALARTIAIATGGNINSLYVLLGRWTAWGLVRRLDSTPIGYAIAPEGERYLSKAPDWFFSGYYCKRRKKRMPGYRGDMDDLRLEIMIASKAVFYWRDASHRLSRDNAIIFYIEAPFNAEHFKYVEIPNNQAGVLWAKDRLLKVKTVGPHAAFEALQTWGFHNRKKQRELADVMMALRGKMDWTN
ncbi:hypothetical protein ACFLUB_04280 [Chloroflexota bacterium]